MTQQPKSLTSAPATPDALMPFSAIKAVVHSMFATMPTESNSAAKIKRNTTRKRIGALLKPFRLELGNPSGTSPNFVPLGTAKIASSKEAKNVKSWMYKVVEGLKEKGLRLENISKMPDTGLNASYYLYHPDLTNCKVRLSNHSSGKDNHQDARVCVPKSMVGARKRIDLIVPDDHPLQKSDPVTASIAVFSLIQLLCEQKQ